MYMYVHVCIFTQIFWPFLEPTHRIQKQNPTLARNRQNLGGKHTTANGVGLVGGVERVAKRNGMKRTG